MTSPTDQPVLFIPGPTEVDPELRQIMGMPLLGHRDKAVKRVVVNVCSLLSAVVRTSKPCVVENVPATGIMEAAIRNLVRSRSLHLTCGAFGERWVKLTKACGREPVAIQSAWGGVVTPEELAAALDEQTSSGAPPFEAVCITHSETSTGVLSPLRELAHIVREKSPDTLILVDAVTSIAGAELEFDAWDLDLVFAGTQKCLALPPGLALYAISDRALDKARSLDDRGWFLDFVQNVERFAEGATPATPCVPLFFALERQLERIAEEGIENRWTRHRAMQARTRDWATAHGFPFLMKTEEHRSPTVTALENGPHDANALVARARDAGFTLGKGYGKLKESGFRIGHMGDHSLERLERLLAAIAP